MHLPIFTIFTIIILEIGKIVYCKNQSNFYLENFSKENVILFSTEMIKKNSWFSISVGDIFVEKPVKKP